MPDPDRTLVRMAMLLDTAVMFTGLPISVFPATTHAVYAYQANKIAKAVNVQSLILRDTITSLLAGGQIPPSTIESLVSDPSHPLWTSAEIERVLRKHLGNDIWGMVIRQLTLLLDANIRLRGMVEGPSSTYGRYPFNVKEARKTLKEVEMMNGQLKLLVNIGTSVAMVQTLRNLDDMMINARELERVIDRDLRRDDDTRSILTVQTEALGEAADSTLPYISLAIQAVGGHTERPKLSDRDALLDSGASAPLISVRLAAELGLINEDDDEDLVSDAFEEIDVHTAGINQTLPVKGKAKLDLWLGTESDGPRLARIEVYIVYGLFESIILSNTFLNNHPELRDLATNRTVEAQHVQTLWFSKPKKKEKEEEEVARAAQMERNKAGLAPGRIRFASSSTAASDSQASTQCTNV